ncbi:hypothetical protein BV22DRAFT_1044515 [Leucogyrophana mollusca]|uniref:Uncharacterized protein n=1 Tax=Leucogyrophana mollusca TaxID=85980 RepID=A0ACB8BSY3_9AGAM|nr:hypothetical protein BV22DRAFT_1044515 [Leucogyrophana mollusca]
MSPGVLWVRLFCALAYGRRSHSEQALRVMMFNEPSHSSPPLLSAFMPRERSNPQKQAFTFSSRGTGISPPVAAVRTKLHSSDYQSIWSTSTSEHMGYLYEWYTRDRGAFVRGWVHAISLQTCLRVPLVAVKARKGLKYKLSLMCFPTPQEILPFDILRLRPEVHNSPYKDFDGYPDPSRWVKKHEFHHRYIHKQTAKQQIDETCREEFDMYLNFMWGQPEDDVAGIEAVRYLESKGVPFIGMPSHFLAKTKLDFRDAARKHGVRVPDDKTSPRSLYLTEDSVCYTQTAVEEQVRILKEKSGGGEVVVQQFIAGEECSAMVLEMGKNVVALPPTALGFPDDTEPMKQFLHWENKVNPAPALFLPLNHVFFDDVVILQSFPGGHESLMDMLIVTKLAQMRGFEKQVAGIQSGYEEMAPTYDAVSAATNMGSISTTIASQCEMSGTVLDLGCGTGIFGRILHEIKPEQNSEAAMTLEGFDHVVVFGCLHFLDPTIFSAFLSRLFFVARRSIIISVEDIPERYNNHLRKMGYGFMYSWNHTKAVRDFGVPMNWRVAYDQRFDAWDSPKTGDKVFATILRYERVDAGHSRGTNGVVNGL